MRAHMHGSDFFILLAALAIIVAGCAENVGPTTGSGEDDRATTINDEVEGASGFDDLPPFPPPPPRVVANERPVYPLSEVAQHAAPADCWIAIKGGIYDVTAYIEQHPGGDRSILRLCGTDGSAAFDAKHGGQTRPEATLERFRIGSLPSD